MSGDKVVLTLKRKKDSTRIDGTRVVFSAYKCFAFDDGADDVNCLRILADHLSKEPGLAVYGTHQLLGYLLKHNKNLRSAIRFIITDASTGDTLGFPTAPLNQIPPEVQTVFLTAGKFADAFVVVFTTEVKLAQVRTGVDLAALKFNHISAAADFFQHFFIRVHLTALIDVGNLRGVADFE